MLQDLAALLSSEEREQLVSELESELERLRTQKASLLQELMELDKI